MLLSSLRVPPEGGTQQGGCPCLLSSAEQPLSFLKKGSLHLPAKQGSKNPLSRRGWDTLVRRKPSGRFLHSVQPKGGRSDQRVSTLPAPTLNLRWTAPLRGEATPERIAQSVPPLLLPSGGLHFVSLRGF